MVNKKIFQKGSIYLCKRLHAYAICLRAHIIKHMIISVICTNMRKGNSLIILVFHQRLLQCGLNLLWKNKGG